MRPSTWGVWEKWETYRHLFHNIKHNTTYNVALVCTQKAKQQHYLTLQENNPKRDTGFRLNSSNFSDLLHTPRSTKLIWGSGGYDSNDMVRHKPELIVKSRAILNTFMPRTLLASSQLVPLNDASHFHIHHKSALITFPHNFNNSYPSSLWACYISICTYIHVYMGRTYQHLLSRMWRMMM